MLVRILRVVGLCMVLLLVTACSPSATEPLSGTIEAEELPIVAEAGGTIVEVAVEEGTELKQQQRIARIDPVSYRIAVEEAEALLAQATAKLEEAMAGTRNQNIRKGIAAVEQAEASLMLSTARQKQAGANQERAKGLLSQAESQLQGAKRTLSYQQTRWKEAVRLYESGAISKRDYDAQQEAVSQAQTQVEQFAAQVAAQRANYLSAKSEWEAAQAQAGTARAALSSASAELELLQEGNTDFTLRQLLAAQKQAKAKLELAKWQLGKTEITAPADGILLRKNVSQGEVAKPGATLFTMMKKNRLTLTVYVPEADLGKVRVGQQVKVQVDAYPGETFAGLIRSISDQAEFTPKNVQTRDERTKLVFAVTIEIQEGFDKLKPGMPADILLQQGGETP